MPLGCEQRIVLYSVPLKFPVLLSISFSCEFLALYYGVASGFKADAFAIMMGG